MSSTSATSHRYILPHDGIEQSRLSSQYKFVKKIFDCRTAVPEWLDMSTVTEVVDVASGTLVWIFDLLCSPEIKARMLPSSQNPIRLYACDITDAKFPTRDELESLGVNTFLQDVTRPFPQSMNGKFDLVHMSYVRFSLNEEGWKSALLNIREILKPGGLIYLFETDNIFYSATSPPPAENAQHDIDASMNGNSWIHKLNAVYTSATRANGYIPDLSYRLRPLLTSADFSVVAFERNFAPFGKLCYSYKGLKGTDLSDAAEFSTENLRLITQALVKDQFLKGKLEAPMGHEITTEESCQELIEEIVDRSREEGCSLIISAYVARKEGV